MTLQGFPHRWHASQFELEPKSLNSGAGPAAEEITSSSDEDRAGTAGLV